MADPMLTSLCAICHVSAPKYKCPRCKTQTCSLACTKKHKSWASCSGERDPTTYLPPSKLRTPAGVDHDYNFLHGIERSLERKEKVLVGEKALLQAEELRPLTTQEVRWKTGRDGRKRKVLVTKTLREAKGRTFERFLAQRLKKYNVGVLCAPTGMSRQKENLTTLNRRSGRINWQVEWFGVEGGSAKPKRYLAKAMDDVPLYQAYCATADVEAKPQQRPAVVKDAQPATKPPRLNMSRWIPAQGCMQDPLRGTWVVHDGRGLDAWPEEQRQRYNFYLARPQTRSDLPTTLTKLQPDDCLRDVLTNTRVLEFPTIYVFEAGVDLPAAYVLGEKDIMPEQTNKRKEDFGGKKDGAAQKRRKQGQEDDDMADGDGLEGVSAGLEAGEVIAEQSLDEEDDDDGESDTSSSGSDSDDSE